MIVAVARKPLTAQGFGEDINYDRNWEALGVKVGWEQTFNIVNPAQAAQEMDQTAAQCPHCSQPKFKMLFSWPAGERPSQLEAVTLIRQTLSEASKFCKYNHGGQPVDLNEFQLVLNSHENTPFFHVHGELNRVHPVTFRAVNMNRGFDQINFQHALRTTERQFDWSLVDANPRYKPPQAGGFVKFRLNPKPEKSLSRKQRSFMVYRQEIPPEARLREILRDVDPATLGNIQAVDRYLQSRSLHYRTGKRNNSKEGPCFLLDGHPVPVNRIRNQADEAVWSPEALRKIDPRLTEHFTLGYPVSKIPRRRNRKRKAEAILEGGTVDLSRTGRDDIDAGKQLFEALGAKHFIAEIKVCQVQPDPAMPAQPTGEVIRFPLVSLDELQARAGQLRVAEFEGAQIGFIPVRPQTVYVAASNLNQQQVQALKQDYNPALVLQTAADNFSVLVAARAFANQDANLAAARMFAAELHTRFHSDGSHAPPPVYALPMPGFRPTLGRPVGSPPKDVQLMEASQHICDKASRRLSGIAIDYKENLLHSRGSLFAVAYRELKKSSADEYAGHLVGVARAHMLNLQFDATPPATWEEVDRQLALRLRVGKVEEWLAAEVLAKFVSRTRTPPDNLLEYVKSVVEQTVTNPDCLKLQDMACEWEAVGNPKLKALQASKKVTPVEPLTPETPLAVKTTSKPELPITAEIPISSLPEPEIKTVAQPQAKKPDWVKPDKAKLGNKLEKPSLRTVKTFHRSRRLSKSVGRSL